MNMNDITNLFIQYNRSLVSANTPEQWTPAIQSMNALLDDIEQQLINLIDTSSPVDQARLFSILLTVMGEAGQYRHEQFNPDTAEGLARKKLIDEDYLPATGRLRQQAIRIGKQFLLSPMFESLKYAIQQEIFPLLDSMDPHVAPNKYMPFRIIQIANVVDRLYSFRVRTNEVYLVGDNHQIGLLREIYNRKYLRFGTSGVRGRWGEDFTENRAKQVVQTICDYLKAQNTPEHVGAKNFSGKRIVIGYDSRRNARLVAEWVAQVCLANGFKVDFANRDTPTPVLVYYLTDNLKPEETAGLINCTASHNPPEWQGIKFNPHLGYPAPTNITDFIAFRINEMQLLGQDAQVTNLAEAEKRGLIRGFDPITDYTNWIMDNGNGNKRIPIDVQRMARFYADKLVLIDEMHGAGRGYLSKLLGLIGIRHEVIHAERDPNIPGLDYANPEEPFINPLKEAVKRRGAYIGVGMDTDADRFGIVDTGGVYFRPNQILPMLVKYLGMDRGLDGRVIATQTGSPLIEVLAGQIPGNDEFKPNEGTVPLYVRHPFYQMKVGKPEDRVLKNAFLVPVGIKYIEEIRRLDRSYRSPKQLPANWRDLLLIGGEESSGLTTRGHVTDKDGIWANLLILDMLAYYAEQSNGEVDTINAIWERTYAAPGCWRSYGGKEEQGSNSGRVDVDAILEAKEALIDYFLDYLEAGRGETFAGMEIVFLGGIRYDIAELQLRDEFGDDQHYLRVRASGTEPINRIYVESSRPEIAQTLIQEALQILEQASVEQVQAALTEWRLVDIISQTQPGATLVAAVKQVMQERGWGVTDKLIHSMPTLEHRTQKIAKKWLDELTAA